MADPSIHYLRVFKMEILKMHIADSLSAGGQDYGGVPSRATWGAEVLNTVDWAAKGDHFFVKARQDGLKRREVRLQAVQESSNGCFMYGDSSLLGPLGIVNLEMITMCPL